MAHEQKPALLIMAAGMGSRFGGLKQITPVGPGGEMIIDYSIYDALRAGFGKVVFVIKKEIEETFRANIGDRIAALAPVEYVFQELDKLPDGYAVPPGRVKPWGTGHAVLCAAPALDGPFMVINADDFYGADSYRQMAAFLRRPVADGKRHLAMAGYVLDNTLTDNGYVSRGICSVDERGYLTGLTERTHIERRNGGAAYTEDDGATWHPLAADCPVSMNCWGFPAGATASFADSFRAFLEGMSDPLKAEFYLPKAVDDMVESGAADVRVLSTTAKWYGMTYTADREQVIAAIRALVDAGEYPARLWD
ncbi:MAG: nucleotidyltransferase family protein [Acutalibacteraceae bacterium]|jgi:hypothetical protein